MKDVFYYKKNRIKQLRAFCAVSQEGGISKAADVLCLSQPTVSLQLQALERELDQILFERRGPLIQPTPEGKVLYEIAHPLVQGVDGLKESFLAHCGKLETGELKIAAGESTILYILPKPVIKFHKTYPGININLANVTGRDGLEMIRKDEVDFAIGSMIDVPDDIVYEPVVTYKTKLITPKGHPLSKIKNLKLSDISPYGLILPPRHLSTWGIVKTVFAQNAAEYNVALEAGGWEVVKRYVELGFGVSIVIDVCLDDDSNVEQIPLDMYFPDRSYGIVRRRGRFFSPQAKCFLEIIRAVYEKKLNKK